MIDLIGRADEAAAVTRFIDEVPRGPVGLLIDGEPGIGKTTVVSLATTAARARGHRVLEARPAEPEADLSFTVLGDLLGEALDDVGDALPRPQRDALEIALLRTGAAHPADPRTTATALVTILTSLARRDPVLIALDDEQWIDGASRRVLEFAVRRLPPRTGVLAARRSGGSAGARDLTHAVDPGRVRRLAIGPMSLPTLHALIRSRLGLQLARPILVRIAEMSGGNPFYALEIANAIVRSDETPGLGEPLPVPGTLQELLRDRVERLSPSAWAVASAAAALSRPTAAIVGAAVSPDHDVDAALADVEASGVLVSMAIASGSRTRCSRRPSTRRRPASSVGPSTAGSRPSSRTPRSGRGTSLGAAGSPMRMSPAPSRRELRRPPVAVHPRRRRSCTTRPAG